jgi:hypothetical protein
MRCLVQAICQAHPALCTAARDLCQLLFQYDPEALEIQKACMSTGTGIWIMWAGYEKQLDGSALYVLLKHLLPDWIWGLIFVAIGVFQMVALKRNAIQCRASGAMMSFVLWSFITALLTVTVTPSPITPIFALLALSDAWLYLRITLHENQEERADGDKEVTC